MLMDIELKNLNVDIDKGVCTITLDRPEFLNVLNEETLKEFQQVLEDVERNEDAKVVVLLSAGEKTFTAGADIKEMSTKDCEQARVFAQYGQRIASKLETLLQPVIIGINGYALGGGVELACACDIRIAAEGSVFAQPEIDLGIIPGWGGTQRLSRIVGIAKAKEMIYTGKRIGTYEAKDIGLVNYVVPKEKLDESVLELAHVIASKGKKALFSAKRTINKFYETFLDEGLEFELEKWTELFETYDQKEGMKAFLEGRQPEFKDE